MLSGQGNAGELTVKNNNMSNQQKSNFVRAAHFFCTILCSCFARLQRESSRNLLQLHILWRKCRTCSHLLFFTAAHFHLPLVAASISYFLTATAKFSCCSSNKKMSPLLFISCSRSLSLFLVHSLACRLLSLFLCLSLALFSKFVDMTINLSLILQTTRIQKQLPLSFIVFIDSSVVSALKDSGGYAISSQNNLELHLGCYTC